MNDFTKEELSILYRSLNHMLEINYFIQPSSFELLNKIQSLIDNYCEHENGGELEIFIDVCKKCNSYLLRDIHYE